MLSDINLLTCIFMGVIFVLFLAVLTCLFIKTHQVRKAIDNIKKNKNLKSNDKHLKQLCINFHKDKNEALGGHIPLENYFNIKNIFYVYNLNKQFMDAFPGVLTTLGILGTFIGLAIGIDKLNLDENADLMQESIKGLISGMNTAFYTSIVGISCSLLFLVIYKVLLNQLDNRLSKMINDINTSENLNSENVSFGLFMKYQAEQTEALKHLGTDFASQMNALLTPSLNKINDTVNSFADVATENQAESLNKVVEHFMVMMNESMQGQFDNLSNTIKELCEWQMQTKESLSDLVGEIKENAQNIKEINISCEEVILKFSDYFTKINTVNQAFVEKFKELQVVVSQLDESINRHKEIEEYAKQQNELLIEKTTKMVNNNIERLKQQEENTSQQHQKLIEQTKTMINESINHLQEQEKIANKNMKQSLVEMATYFESNTMRHEKLEKALNELVEQTLNKYELNSQQLTNYAETIKTLNANMQNSAKEFSDNLHRGLNTSFKQYDENIAQALSSLAGTIEEIDAAVDRLPEKTNIMLTMVTDAFQKMNNNDEKIEDVG